MHKIVVKESESYKWERSLYDDNYFGIVDTNDLPVLDVEGNYATYRGATIPKFTDFQNMLTKTADQVIADIDSNVGKLGRVGHLLDLYDIGKRKPWPALDPSSPPLCLIWVDNNDNEYHLRLAYRGKWYLTAQKYAADYNDFNTTFDLDGPVRQLATQIYQYFTGDLE